MELTRFEALVCQLFLRTGQTDESIAIILESEYGFEGLNQDMVKTAKSRISNKAEKEAKDLLAESTG